MPEKPMSLRSTSRAMERAMFIRSAVPNADKVSLLAGDASFRKYYRVRTPDSRLVLMDAPPEKEDVRPFIAITHHLLAQGFSAPSILAQDVELGFLLLEDFGDNRFSNLLPPPANLTREEALYRHAVDVLIALHQCPLPADITPYSPEKLEQEGMLLPDWYVMHITGRACPESARQAYQEAWQPLLSHPALMEQPVLVLRDYHADNLMWLPDREGIRKVGLLDYQDAVAGHASYDLL
ncbi:MAG: phosphotransferase, partial [Rickettsiales bacterium]|nr:phosphotransferase [Rickettsiales bacterium]